MSGDAEAELQRAPGTPREWMPRERVTVKRRGGFRTRYRIQWLRVLVAMFSPRELLDSWNAQLERLTEAQHMEDLQRVCPHEAGMLRWFDDRDWAYCNGCGAAVLKDAVVRDG